MQSRINRREILKLGMLVLSGLAFRPYFKPGEPPQPDLWGRVTIEEIDVYTEPRSDVSLIVGKRYRDQLVVLYYALNAPEGPAYNPVWYRVWGGCVHPNLLRNTWVPCWEAAAPQKVIPFLAFPGHASLSLRQAWLFMALTGITTLAYR